MRSFGLFLGALLLALPGHAAPTENEPVSIAHKRAHLATVVAELAQRDVGHLTPAQRVRRAEALKLLTAYAARGKFPVNTERPSFELPYFIDKYGTRCALAHVVDKTGHRALIERLAASDNHAWVAHLLDDRALGAWLTAHGLSVEEAAFIQAPGFNDDPPIDDGEPPTVEDPPIEDTESTIDTEPGDGEGRVPPAPRPTTGRTPRTRRAADAGGWARWWRYNRDAFVNLRRRYHASATTTSRVGGGRARRPSDAQRTSTLLPAFAELSRPKSEVRSTALVAWAMSAKSTAPAAVGTLDYLRRKENRYRNLTLLGLGLARDKGATQTLRDILNDTSAGRRALSRAGKVPAATRAFAAIALGFTEDEGVVADLLKVAQNEKNRVDLRASAVTALGLLLPHAASAVRTETASALAAELKRARWDRPVVAAIPAALIRSGDVTGRMAVVKIVARFRGKADVRASCALALGMASHELDPEIADALMAASRRDPDLQTRRFATIALGELCARETSGAPDEKLVKRLQRHFMGTLDGHFKVRGAMEWHLLAAGLFARRFAAFSNDIASRLIRVATKGGSRDERAAAVIGLGLSGNPRGRDALVRLLGRAKDVTLRGAVAESLGLLEARDARPALRKLALEDKSDTVRYQAALGLGYLADGAMIEPLVEQLGDTGSRSVRAALTRVLGQLGDRRAVDGLIELAKDTRNSRDVRERALGALGLIGRESDESWTLPLRRGTNFAAATPTMRTVLGIF